MKAKAWNRVGARALLYVQRFVLLGSVVVTAVQAAPADAGSASAADGDAIATDRLGRLALP